MTDQEIQDVGPVFSQFLGRFRDCFPRAETRGHFDNYCRGLLSDLPRKTVEPLALASGTVVRTLQQFLAARKWDHGEALRTLQTHLVEQVAAQPGDSLGTIGVVDETSCRKWGDRTPGVQRQYLGCVGKVDNGIVTVHVGVAKGSFQTLLDEDLFLPESWSNDRERCRAAGIPDDVVYRPKWKIALEQLRRLRDAGFRFSWLTFDEYYGSKVPFLAVLDLAGQRFVAEVPVNFSVKTKWFSRSRRADAALTKAQAKRGERFRLKRKTVGDVVWRAAERRVQVRGETGRLVVAISESTGEVKYFVSNDLAASLKTVLRVAFRRATIEHRFRLGQQEVGLMHFEGQQFVALQRHLILALIVLGFVALHTERLRGKKSGDHARASLRRVEPTLWRVTLPSSRPVPATTNPLRAQLPTAA